MATLVTESWNGANGAAWPAQWASGAYTGASTTIQGNSGVLSFGTGNSNAGARAMLTGMAVRGNTDVVVTLVGTGAKLYAEVFVNASGSGGGVFGLYCAPDEGYGMEIGFPATGSAGSVKLMSETAASETQFVTTPVTLTLGTKYIARVQRVGQLLQGKIWQYGSAEPTAWTASYTLTGTPKTGVAYLGGQNSNTTGGMVTFNDLTVSDPTYSAESVAWLRI